MGWGGWNREWRPYVPVWQRRQLAERKLAKLRKKGPPPDPVDIPGREIATTFWGRAWCDNLEAYSDFENRLPRGRTYVRNGSVVDLRIESGKVVALVSGSDLYTVQVGIRPLDPRRWTSIRQACAGGIDSLVELLQGRFSRGVMEVITRKGTGLFPAPGELTMKCSCPDWATMCKHVAATLYGVGARLDEHPELLFVLRHVDHTELIREAGRAAALDRGAAPASARVLPDADLGGLFGIELDASRAASPATSPRAAAKPRRGVLSASPSPRSRAAAKSRSSVPVAAPSAPSPVVARALQVVSASASSSQATRRAVAKAPRVKAPAPAKKKSLSVKVAAARRLQGQYLGLLRLLPASLKQKVRTVARVSGLAAAVALMKTFVIC
ncbi:MAG: hypothetical protein HY905_12385 [Deltaproteobacteria bacterium]|nr:hypothetical protein [Deltaproteobacteria bacterium]